MIPYVRLHHHHRKDHLSGVVVHLGGGVPGVILGVERTGVAGIDFEYVGSDGSCDNLIASSDRLCAVLITGSVSVWIPSSSLSSKAVGVKLDCSMLCSGFCSVCQ